MDKDHQHKSSTKSTIRQIFICLVANLPSLSGGMTLGFSAVAIPHMTKPNSTLHLTDQQASLLASCVSLSLPVGSLLSGATMEKIGRRGVLLLSCVPAAIGWLIMAIFPIYNIVIAGRLLTGFATGFCCHCATVYMAESSSTSLRGFLINGTNLGFSSGVLTVYILGLILKEKWRYIAGLGGMIPIIAVPCLMKWMPESPVWLAIKGRTDHALKSLARLRKSHCKSPLISAELREMMKNSEDQEEGGISFVGLLKGFLQPESYKPLIIMLTFLLFQQISGSFVVIFYGVNVVTEAGVSINPFVLTVLIGLTNVMFTLVVAWASQTFGRRPCTIFSGSGMTISLVVLALYTHWMSSNKLISDSNSSNELIQGNTSEHLNISSKDLASSTDMNQNDYAWIPTVAILSFIMSSTLGFLSLPWAMLGEVFPVAVRGVACGICTCVAYIINFLVIMAYPPMIKDLGSTTVFTLYGAMSFIGTIFIIKFLPETQNKTLAQIEEYFAGNKRKRKERHDEKESVKFIMSS